MIQRDPEKTTPPQPEERPKVRPARPAEETEHKPGDHQGAVETDVADVTPPARGPADPAGETDTGDDEVDPTEDLTPG
jgi:hypothetical protein